MGEIKYLFPTTLSPTDIGFGNVSGTVALAIMSHPDYDDTPLWDENRDSDYHNDGAEYHTHWVILRNDQLTVRRSFRGKNIVPLTAPRRGNNLGSAPIMYLDSPGFPVTITDDTIQVLVPAQRVSHNITFGYNGVTVEHKRSLSDGRPILRKTTIFDIRSRGETSSPIEPTFRIGRKKLLR